MRVVSSILGKVSDEAARYAESHTLRRIAADFGKASFAVSLAYAWSFPHDTWQHVWHITSAFNFFAPKFAFSCVLGFMVLPRIWKRYHGEENAECVDGVPVSELIDHLFAYRSFKRDDAESVFAMPRNRYQSLAKRMDELGIFVRGENNSRVLNPELSRKEVAALVRGEGSESKLAKFRSYVEDAISPSLPDHIPESGEMVPALHGAVETDARSDGEAN